MYKAIIIDDEPPARNLIAEYLESYSDISVAEECSNGFEGVKAITKHKPDLVFLDVQMPKINGFEMLELLDDMPSVIFTTAFDEYAIRAFEASAVDYLLKPFSRERFGSAINKWKERLGNSVKQDLGKLIRGGERQQDERNRIVVRNNNEISIVSVNDIHYIEAFDDYVKIFTQRDYFLKKKTMSYFENTLDPSQFFRVHRSFIINLRELTSIEPYEKNAHIAVLKSGKKIPLSRSGYARIREKFDI